MTNRKHETVVELRVEPEAVWKALTEAEGLTRWFALDARIDKSGPGGAVWISWGKEMEGEFGKVRDFDPPRRLTWVGSRGGVELVSEFLLEGSGGMTTLRIVASGFGGEEWDDEYEGTKNGWRLFMAALKHSLERHPGEARIADMAMLTANAARTAVWTKLLAALGDVPGEGASIRMTLQGATLTGTVVQRVDGATLAFTADELGDGLVSIELGPSERGSKTYLSATVGAFGDRASRDAVAGWRERLQQVFASL